MTTIQALLLGLIQGTTEFFPVSSSGHLKLFQHLFGFEQLDQYILFDLVVHLGTLGAIFWVFAQDIRDLVVRRPKQVGLILIALAPLFPLLAIMKPIKALMDQPQYLGYFFICTAALLWAGIRLGREREARPSRWGDALIIGGFQALAVLPGISRSGSTISGARLLGWSPQEALTFSFLLAIPTILGGTSLELIGLYRHGAETVASIPLSNYIIGYCASLFSGIACLLALKALVRKQAFMYFAWYCLVLGVLTLILLR